jgi:peptidase M28-like protein
MASLCAPAAELPDAAARWWRHVSYLADDAREGRATASAAHREAAAYVAARFKDAGLKPVMQSVPLLTRKLAEERSSVRLLGAGGAETLVSGEDILLNVRHRPPKHLRAPLIFAGYGLVIPEKGVDAFSGTDVRGKVVVFLTGAPASVPGAVAAHYQSGEERARTYSHLGAAGFLAVSNPRTTDIPWERRKQSREVLSMTLRGGEARQGLFAGTLSPARAEKLFAGTDHPIAGILAQANAGRPLPSFDLKTEIEADVEYTEASVRSENVLAMLAGSDPSLRRESVVLTAHLDHLGQGRRIAGDGLYNGAMDNASGVASILEIATALARDGRRPRRSIVFAAVTGEERGLLGSAYLAAHLPGKARAVANLNIDMFLPLFPLTRITAIGLEESDLRQDIEAAARAEGVAVEGDPETQRNRFIRSDQYSFIRRGVPALAFKLGYEKGSAEEKIVRKWTAERYHAPSDDLAQPVDREAAARFNRLLERLVREVADRDRAPRWNSDSFFRRFAGLS